VSERPMTETSTFSRLRKPMGSLSDLPIWSKLGLIMIVPTIATIVVGTAGLVENVAATNGAERTRTLARLSYSAGGLVHELQNERATAVVLAGAGPADRSKITQDFDRQIGVSDASVTEYRARRSSVADDNDEGADAIAEADQQLGDLGHLREEVRAGSAITQSNIAFRYLVIIAGLINVRGDSSESALDTRLHLDQESSSALSDMKEALNQERIVVLRAITERGSGGGFTPALRREFERTLAGQEEAVARFKRTAAVDRQDAFDQAMAGSDLRQATKFEGDILGLGATGGTAVTLGATEWNDAISTKADLLRRVESDLDLAIVADASTIRNNLQRTVLVETGLLLSMLLLAIVFAWAVARSMARSLRELRHGALTVAQYGLPQAVARLRDPSLAVQASPDQVAKQIAEPLPVRSRDEFGQVTEAFNAVHLEAVRTAAEQAQLRASVATMFVNLARRSQILVDRLIGHLDRLERGEEDPDRLGELFQLDHLATRMRRNDENLLVLAGADSSRVQREPAPLMDVLRAAQSEVEHYTRIEFGVIDRDVEIAAHSVNDMVHLIAELLDNATAFSPPDSAVMVEARRVGDRAVLLVEDEGIGISPDQLRELNDKLANPPVVDVAVSRMMGLVVVARLAARHGVRVEMRPGRERGTIADITLPATVLNHRVVAARGGPGMPIAGAGLDRSVTMPQTSMALDGRAAAAGGLPGRERADSGAVPFNPAASLGQTFRQSGGAGLSPASGNGTPSVGGGFGPPPPPMRAGPPPAVRGGGGQPPAVRGGGGGGGGGGQPPPVRGGQPPRLGQPAAFGGGPSGGPPPMFHRPAGAIEGPGGSSSRGLPPWSDLTGVNGNGNGTHPPGPDPSRSPLPQRRARDNRTVEGEVSKVDSGGVIPRQRPVGPEGTPPGDVPPPSVTKSGGIPKSGGINPGSLRAGEIKPRGSQSGRPGAPAAGAGQAAGPVPSPGPMPGPGPMPSGPAPSTGDPRSSGPDRSSQPAASAATFPTVEQPIAPPPPPQFASPPLPVVPAPASAPPAWPPAAPTSGPAAVPVSTSGPPSPAPSPAAESPSDAGRVEAPAAETDAPVSGSPVSGSPVSGSPVSGSPVSGSPVSASPMPASPAPGPPAQSGAERGPVLDMTEEIPRIRDDWEPSEAVPRAGISSVTSSEPSAAEPNRPPASSPGIPDETMELPIYRALESAWFRTQRSSPMALVSPIDVAEPGFGDLSGEQRSDKSAAASTGGGPVSSGPEPLPTRGRPESLDLPLRPTVRPDYTSTPVVPAPATPPPAVPAAATPPPVVPAPSAPPGFPLPPRIPGEPSGVGAERESVSASADRTTPGESVTWRTAADDGWRAAEAIGREQDFAMTDTGLPKRVPMSQLVPGGVEKGTTTAHRRSPEAVRGLLSAYHRGVQRGRSSHNPTSAESRPPQSTQTGRNPGGKEHEA
jgi:signal transduction histidine kinase